MRYARRRSHSLTTECHRPGAAPIARRSESSRSRIARLSSGQAAEHEAEQLRGVRARRAFARGAVQVLGYWTLDTTPDW